MIQLRYCMVCGLALSFHKSVLRYPSTYKQEFTDCYNCDNRCCQLPPFTRYISTYVEDKLLYHSIVVDIDSAHYVLMTNFDNPKTSLGKLRPWIEQNEDGEDCQYIYNYLYEINKILNWTDVYSAVDVVSRLLKIKAFS